MEMVLGEVVLVMRNWNFKQHKKTEYATRSNTNKI